MERLRGGDLALDAEVVALDASGRASFARLQQRMHVVRGVARLAAMVPVVAYVYDCLALHGRDLRGLPLRARKDLVHRLVGRPDTLRYCDHVEGHGAAFLDAACRAGAEGVVAKRADAPYHGGRSADWRKVKCQLRQEFVIGGWTDPQGTRSYLGAVHLGVYENADLTYAGRAGSGLDTAGLRDLHARLERLATAHCPFTRGNPPRGRAHHWVEPRLVCEVRFTEWTEDGQLRHPVFLGLREDKQSREVRRERAATPRS
jgi:bifunctional non-homologous end joining protein LigD